MSVLMERKIYESLDRIARTVEFIYDDLKAIREGIEGACEEEEASKYEYADEDEDEDVDDSDGGVGHDDYSVLANRILRLAEISPVNSFPQSAAMELIKERYPASITNKETFGVALEELASNDEIERSKTRFRLVGKFRDGVTVTERQVVKALYALQAYLPKRTEYTITHIGWMLGQSSGMGEKSGLSSHLARLVNRGEVVVSVDNCRTNQYRINLRHSASDES